jgi:hypothetical protein
VLHRVDSGDLRGIRTFQEELHPRKCIVICNETSERKAGEIDILPYRNFLTALRGKKLLAEKLPEGRLSLEMKMYYTFAYDFLLSIKNSNQKPYVSANPKGLN